MGQEELATYRKYASVGYTYVKLPKCLCCPGTWCSLFAEDGPCAEAGGQPVPFCMFIASEAGAGQGGPPLGYASQYMALRFFYES